MPSTVLELSESVSVFIHKNLRRLWLAYTEFQGDFYMLQFISVDSRHFTQSGCELSLTPPINEKDHHDHGHLWVECALCHLNKRG